MWSFRSNVPLFVFRSKWPICGLSTYQLTPDCTPWTSTWPMAAWAGVVDALAMSDSSMAVTDAGSVSSSVAIKPKRLGLTG